jgi:GntR family transcriptional regulator
MATTVLSTGGMPLHRQIFLVLRDQIASGLYGSGEALPTEEALGGLYGVSRITVRRALQDLADQGYVQRRQGRGTYVSEPIEPPAGDHASIRATLERVQAETRARVVEFGRRVAPPAIRGALDLLDGTEVLYVLRVRSKADHPLMITEAWLPEPHASVVTKAALRRRALYELVEGSGVHLGRFVQEISAEIADPVRARLLGTEIGAALLRIDRLVHDEEGIPVMRNTVLVDARRSHILSDVPSSDIDTAATGVLVHGPSM